MKSNVFTKKLKSKTGASILLALAFFLLCFFVASVVMASASVNASRAIEKKEEQRSYFAIQSAQNLIKSMFKEINGENRLQNVQQVLVDQKSGDAGEVIDLNTTIHGGFHLREISTVYDWCNEGRMYQLQGKLKKDGLNLSVNAEKTDVEYENAVFGIDCIGDDSAVFLKSSIEEVATLALCKRLYDQGVKNLDGYGTFSTYFDEMDDDFDLATKKAGALSDQLKYVYYFDITPESDAGNNQKNIPTVHVKMTADNQANLYFELTVDSHVAATYSASLKATATIETLTPQNDVLENPHRYTETCTQRSTPEKTESHLVTRTINDTYVTWYTKNIEITKGIKVKKTT